MKVDHVARVQQLLALAGHPDTPLEEARTAAHQAAKLFAKHKMTIGRSSTHATQSAESTAARRDHERRDDPDRPREPWESSPEERAAANRAYEARMAAERAEKAAENAKKNRERG